MIELLIFAVGYAFLAALNFYRLAKGPTAADRMVAGDSMDVLVCCALVLYAMYSGPSTSLSSAPCSASSTRCWSAVISKVGGGTSNGFESYH